MTTVYQRPSLLPQGVNHTFCPGCMHGTTVKLMAEVLDEIHQQDNVVCIGGVGCNANMARFFDIDTVGSPHGRACAVASAYKRCNPDTLVFSYQGDGDLAAIGLAETMSAANRGENFTVIFINNAIYGMTGGQLAPTTLLGMKTTTTSDGRMLNEHGAPLHMCEILSGLEATAYIARGTCDTPQNVKKTREYIKKAFECQMAGKGFSMVEVLSSCPSNWGMSPLKSLEFIQEKMIPEYPLGEFKSR